MTEMKTVRNMIRSSPDALQRFYTLENVSVTHSRNVDEFCLIHRVFLARNPQNCSNTLQEGTKIGIDKDYKTKPVKTNNYTRKTQRLI